MKHFFKQSTAALIGLASAAMLISACTSSRDDLPEPEAVRPALPSLVSITDSVIRFEKINQLELMTASQIPGEFSGFELTGLEYVCVDTVELRALRFAVTAELLSTKGESHTVTFNAEVGPELVSVEYYPTGEWVPPHDNMLMAYYPCVERYRNYSDGSRIGPDLFYDYGHFHIISEGLWVGIGYGYLNCYLNNWGNALTDEQIFRNGILLNIVEEQIEVNMNAVVVFSDGRRFTGDDLVPHHPEWWNKVPLKDPKDRFFHALGCYYDVFPGCGSGYGDSRGFNLEDEETSYFVNLCKDVPDVSPQPFPKDIKSLKPGWYFGNVYDVYYEPFAYSALQISSPYFTDNDFGYEGGSDIFTGLECYLQYLVIDGRIIHYDDMVRDYKGILNLNPQITETKTSYGYNIHRETSHKYIGADFKTIYDLHIKCTDGPEEVFDESYCHEMSQADRNEIDKLNNGTRSTRQDLESPACIEREDGRYMIIDRRLPSSITSLPLTCTMK